MYQESEIVEEDIDIKGLKDKFNKYIQKYKVIDFLKQDPLIGIPYDLPTEIDIFQIYISYLLDNAILLQKEEVFVNIYKFSKALDNYNRYLALNMCCNTSCTFFLFNKFLNLKPLIFLYQDLNVVLKDSIKLFYISS